MWAVLLDPIAGKASSTRLGGLVLIVAGIVFAFTHPQEPVTTGEFLAAGLACLGLRRKAEAAEKYPKAGGGF